MDTPAATGDRGDRPAKARFRIVLADAGGPGDAPIDVRLKAALKRLLRQYGLRAESAVELPASKDT